MKKTLLKTQSILVDTNVFIDYLSRRKHRDYLEQRQWRIYYSAVTRRELFAKQGLSNQERQRISLLLKRYRQINITHSVAILYSNLRQQYPTLERGDALIAATALVQRLPLLTGNHRHFHFIDGLRLIVP